VKRREAHSSLKKARTAQPQRKGGEGGVAKKGGTQPKRKVAAPVKRSGDQQIEKLESNAPKLRACPSVGGDRGKPKGKKRSFERPEVNFPGV